MNPVAPPRVVDLASTTPSAAASPAPFVHLDIFAPSLARRALLPAAPAGPAVTWTAPLRDIEGARVRLDGLLAGRLRLRLHGVSATGVVNRWNPLGGSSPV